MCIDRNSRCPKPSALLCRNARLAELQRHPASCGLQRTEPPAVCAFPSELSNDHIPGVNGLGVGDSAVRKGLGPIFRSGQFRSIEVATLEKRQRHFENPRLTSLEFKFLPTLRRRATRPELCLAFSKFGLLSDNNPSPTSGTRDARARNAISHFKIIGRFASWTSPFWRSIPGSILSRPQFFCIRLILCPCAAAIVSPGRRRFSRRRSTLKMTLTGSLATTSHRDKMWQ